MRSLVMELNDIGSNLEILPFVHEIRTLHTTAQSARVSHLSCYYNMQYSLLTWMCRHSSQELLRCQSRVRPAVHIGVCCHLDPISPLHHCCYLGCCCCWTPASKTAQTGRYWCRLRLHDVRQYDEIPLLVQHHTDVPPCASC